MKVLSLGRDIVSTRTLTTMIADTVERTSNDAVETMSLDQGAADS